MVGGGRAGCVFINIPLDHRLRAPMTCRSGRIAINTPLIAHLQQLTMEVRPCCSPYPMALPMEPKSALWSKSSVVEINIKIHIIVIKF